MQNRIAKNTKQNTKIVSVNVKDLWKDVKSLRLRSKSGCIVDHSWWVALRRIRMVQKLIRQITNQYLSFLCYQKSLNELFLIKLKNS